MIEKLVENNRRLRIEYNSILRDCDSGDLEMLNILNNYLSDYCKFYQLSPADVSEKYQLFINRYLLDFKQFIDSGKYPYELGLSVNIDRITYDLALILSVFFTPVRFKIFKHTLSCLKNSTGTILIIGVGAAMELELISKLLSDRVVDAYDIKVSDFVKDRFNREVLHEQEFLFNTNKKYSTILIIELLEHLEKPYDFVANCLNALSDNGAIVCTTSSNMPQFDHLYNFHFDNFVQLLSDNFICKEKIILKHKLVNPNLDSYNTFYNLIKIN